MHRFELGATLRDRVTGLQGIAVGRCEYLNGCVQYGLKGQAKDGKAPDTEYVDQQQLEKIDDGISVDQSHTGGPMRDAPRC